jgi:hypothetical protein
MAHDLWPVFEVGPRMWRWPLNTTRAFCALAWAVIGWRRGLAWSLLRIAWYPATGIGAVAAIIQAAVLIVFITLPVKAVLVVLDSITVLRGGIPPSETPRHRGSIDWDQEFQRLDPTPGVQVRPLEHSTSGMEHGIRLGPDGQALDPADQYHLDQARHAAFLDRVEQRRRDQ